MTDDARGRTASAAARRIARHWNLTDDEAAHLRGIDPSDVRRFYTCTDSGLLSAAGKRLAILVMIWEALASLFGRGPIADGWIRRPNRDFGGRPPLERMMSGRVEDLDAILRYLSLARNQ